MLEDQIMPLYPHSILKKPSEFPPVPFNLEDEDQEEDGEAVDDLLDEADNESLDIILPKRDLNDFSDFDRPATKPGQFAKIYCFWYYYTTRRHSVKI